MDVLHVCNVYVPNMCLPLVEIRSIGSPVPGVRIVGSHPMDTGTCFVRATSALNQGAISPVPIVCILKREKYVLFHSVILKTES